MDDDIDISSSDSELVDNLPSSFDDYQETEKKIIDINQQKIDVSLIQNNINDNINKIIEKNDDDDYDNDDEDEFSQSKNINVLRNKIKRYKENFKFLIVKKNIDRINNESELENILNDIRDQINFSTYEKYIDRFVLSIIAVTEKLVCKYIDENAEGLTNALASDEEFKQMLKILSIENSDLQNYLPIEYRFILHIFITYLGVSQINKMKKSMNIEGELKKLKDRKNIIENNNNENGNKNDIKK